MKSGFDAMPPFLLDDLLSAGLWYTQLQICCFQLPPGSRPCLEVQNTFKIQTVQKPGVFLPGRGTFKTFQILFFFNFFCLFAFFKEKKFQYDEFQ